MAASPATCRRRAGSGSCEARSPPAGSSGSPHPRARRSSPPPISSAVKPIRPMLHKFNYVPISQPILADGGGALRRRADRGGGRVDAGGGRGHRRSRRGRDRADTPAIVDARAALAPGAPLVHDEAAGNVIVEGRVKTPGFDAKLAARAPADQGRHPLAPAECAADRAARRACGLGCRQPNASRSPVRRRCRTRCARSSPT